MKKKLSYEKLELKLLPLSEEVVRTSSGGTMLLDEGGNDYGNKWSWGFSKE